MYNACIMVAVVAIVSCLQCFIRCCSLFVCVANVFVVLHHVSFVVLILRYTCFCITHSSHICCLCIDVF